MKAGEINFLKLLEGKKQFVIPIYQRTYSWKREQCAQLWNDILRAADGSISGHFVGSIVFVQEGLFANANTTQLLVIDGQQRLTTLSLLLMALARSTEMLDGTSPVSRDEIYDYYLTNPHGRGDDRYKLILTRSDREALTYLVDGRDLPSDSSRRIEENFRYFTDQLSELGANLDIIWRGISKLIVVEISLDRSHDNPQLIFESLNSTGMDLSQADLIRNYVLMGLDIEEQSRLYNAYWFPMEQSFGDAYGEHFDSFMRHYLTAKSRSGTIPRIGEVYAEFKKYRGSRPKSSIEDIVADIYRFSRYYTRLAFEKDPDPEVNAAARDINTLEVDVAYPFFLELYDDFAQQRLSSREFVAILRLVESYVFRRAICDIPTNSLNKTFATLTRDIHKDRYLESVEATLLLKDSYRRFPRDDEFRRMFTTRNVYDLSKRRLYLFGKLENFDHREPINVREFTIEHVMPQNERLPIEWKRMLGDNWQDVQSRLLHTIGNLTLTRYNSELSDRPFTEKRDIKGGFRDSHLRLNADLAELDHWDESAIMTRAHRLANLAIRVWHAPDLSPDILAQYTSVTHIGQLGATITTPANLDNADLLMRPAVAGASEVGNAGWAIATNTTSNDLDDDTDETDE